MQLDLHLRGCGKRGGHCGPQVEEGKERPSAPSSDVMREGTERGGCGQALCQGSLPLDLRRRRWSCSDDRPTFKHLTLFSGTPGRDVWEELDMGEEAEGQRQSCDPGGMESSKGMLPRSEAGLGQL